jgi:hypothetical protein
MLRLKPQKQSVYLAILVATMMGLAWSPGDSCWAACQLIPVCQGDHQPSTFIQGQGANCCTTGQFTGGPWPVNSSECHYAGMYYYQGPCTQTWQFVAHSAACVETVPPPPPPGQNCQACGLDPWTDQACPRLTSQVTHNWHKRYNRWGGLMYEHYWTSDIQWRNCACNLHGCE